MLQPMRQSKQSFWRIHGDMPGLDHHDRQEGYQMPEFILDLGTQGATYSALDSFTQGYIEAMFFTCADELSASATFDCLAPETLAQVVEDCKAFQADNADELQGAYETETGYDATMAGRDYWYTRNGHGTGFWDRGLKHFGEALSAACRYDGVELYFGDDGLLYL